MPLDHHYIVGVLKFLDKKCWGTKKSWMILMRPENCYDFLEFSSTLVCAIINDRPLKREVKSIDQVKSHKQDVKHKTKSRPARKKKDFFKNCKFCGGSHKRESVPPFAKNVKVVVV